MILSTCSLALPGKPADKSKEQAQRAADAADAAQVVKRAHRALKQSSELLKQERTRWKNIHDNPVPDKVKVLPLKNGVRVEWEIDTGVHNMINSKPIMRTYDLTTDGTLKEDKSYFLDNFGLLVMASVNVRGQLSPALGVGFHPKLLKQFGAGAYASIYSVGGILYWYPRHKLFSHGLVFVGVGYPYRAETGDKLDVHFGIGANLW